MKSYTFTPRWQFPTAEISVFMKCTTRPTLIPYGRRLAGGRRTVPASLQLVHLQPTTFDCNIFFAAQVGRHFLPLQALRCHYLVFVLSISCFLFCILAPRVSSVAYHSQLSHSHCASASFFFSSSSSFSHPSPAQTSSLYSCQQGTCSGQTIWMSFSLLVMYSLFFSSVNIRAFMSTRM